MGNRSRNRRLRRRKVLHDVVIVVDAPELFATTRSLGNHDIEPDFVHEGRCRAINTQPPLESSANLDRLERSLRNLLEVAETLRERGVALDR